MSKAIIIGIIVLILLIGGFAAQYVFFAGNTSELDETSPLDSLEQVQTSPVQDTLEDMDEATRLKFDAAVAETQDQKTAVQDTMPTTPQIIAQGQFKPRAHEVAGSATLIKHGDQATIRFEDFETINGPRLKIYLSSDLGISDSIDLGDIRATNGNINYPVDPNIDFTRYNKVLVWCEPFRILFSYSELK